MPTRDLWTLAALLYGALLVTIGFAPGKATRRTLPRFLIADGVARLRPLEALVRRLLFAQARTITVTLRPPAIRVLKPKPPAPVTQIITLPHDPLAWRRMMLGEQPLVRLYAGHPLDGDPSSWKHVRFCVSSGGERKTDAAPKPRERIVRRVSTRAPRAPERRRIRLRRSPSIPWYKLTPTEKDERRQRRAARNVAAEIKRAREEALAARPVPERVWSAADLAEIPTTTFARRLEALVRVIRNPVPYARRIARKLAKKPALAAKIARRVARRSKRHVSETFAAAERWIDADLAAACPDSS